MYLEHFGFYRLPFTIAPDPEFLYPSQGHQEALAHLHYALTNHGGLIALTGEVGTGKTTLCRAFLNNTPDDVRTAYLFNLHLSPTELLQNLCDEFGITYDAQYSLRELYRCLNQALLEGYARGERFICVIDEAQNMPPPLLEQVRLLTNLETDKEKLLTLILVGQPELRSVLARHDLRQLNQRITARYHLKQLDRFEVVSYVQYRCEQAGCHASLFSGAALKRLWHASHGIPRLINSLADRALLGAYAKGMTRVSSALVRGAEREILGQAVKPGRLSAIASCVSRWLALPLLLAAVLYAGLSLWRWYEHAQSPAAQLAKEWGLPAQDCAGLSLYGYDCLWVDWPLSEVQRLQQPKLLRTQTSEGLRWRATLTPQERYAGQALVIWQPPVGYSNQLVRPGQRGEIVPWVRQQLGMEWGSQWQVIAPSGQSQSLDEQLYDSLLAQEIERFQREQGLRADRILGPRTLLLLQNLGR